MASDRPSIQDPDGDQVIGRLSWLNKNRENIHAQSDQLPLLSSMNVTNTTLGMSRHLHSETLENMHPSYDTTPTHNSCYQEPCKSCQSLLTIKKNWRWEQHDGFGTRNSKYHQSYLFSDTRHSRISHHSHHTPTFLSKRRYPLHNIQQHLCCHMGFGFWHPKRERQQLLPNM